MQRLDSTESKVGVGHKSPPQVHAKEGGFHFQPPSYPPPPSVTPCSCKYYCECWSDKPYVTKDGRFQPFLPAIEVGPPRVAVWEFLTKDDLRLLQENKFCKTTTFGLFGTKFHESFQMAGNVLYELLYEVLRFCRIHSMNHKKTSAVISCFYLTHKFFQSSPWHTQVKIYNYFKETILLHTVQRPPKSAEILEPEECRETLKHFCNIYMKNLPLLQLTTMPNYRLQLMWPAETNQNQELEGSESINEDGLNGLSLSKATKSSKLSRMSKLQK